MSDAADDEELTCEACGDPVADKPTRRVETWIEDGVVRHRHFCDDECFGRAEE